MSADNDTPKPGETVRIKRQDLPGGVLIIERADYDPATMELADSEQPAPTQPKKAKK